MKRKTALREAVNQRVDKNPGMLELYRYSALLQIGTSPKEDKEALYIILKDGSLALRYFCVQPLIGAVNIIDANDT